MDSKVPKQTEILTYARSLSEDLRQDLRWNPGERGRGWWEASNRSLLPRILARATAALEFLRQYAGADSFWTLRAIAVYDSNGNHESLESGVVAVGDMLAAWADQVEAGVTQIAGAQAWAEVEVAATDIMGQVRRLLEDRDTTPAAPMVLCGAALETAMRAVISARQLDLTEKPSLSAYTRLLRKHELISKQEAKDFDQVAGLRNQAAHGEFDTLSRERAGLMEQQTNLLLRTIADLQE
ncbi:hypothetical protein ACFYXS_37505 [Streptomyces sp. NPDC002574]|uniref:hypothetical protein n=1 Tax=Streptomyces sp. NPDC002574 TaxID=3364652 RepID=UPI0036AF32C7